MDHVVAMHAHDRHRLRERLFDYVRLEETLETTTIIDQAEVRQPDIVCNIFSVPSATEQGASTIFLLEE